MRMQMLVGAKNFSPLQKPEEEESDPDTAVQKKVLLIIDDEPVMLRFLARKLLRRFDEVHTAQTMAEAAQAVIQLSQQAKTVENLVEKLRNNK